MNLKKLRTMSFDEVSFRLKAAGTKKLRKLAQSRYRDRLQPAQFLPSFTLPAQHAEAFDEARSNKDWPAAESILLQHQRARFAGKHAPGAQPKFFLSYQQHEALQKVADQVFNQEQREMFEHAERLLSRRFHYLGVEAKFEGEIDWHRDPLSQREWPKKFYTEMKFYGRRDGEHELPGDVKNVWELNRHQHFTVLGKTYWLTGEERFATELLAQCESWMAQNPFLWGINWTSALEVAMRALSWIWAYVFCLKAEAMKPALHARILRTLHLHGHYVHRHLSFFTSPYNHLIGEATALFFLGALFPEFKEAARWREKGWAILTEEATKQFHADGASVEQAMSYHHFTLGLYLQALLLAQSNGISIPAEMRARLEKALEFSMHAIQPDGRHPMIGDNDNAFAFYFGEKAGWDYRDYLALGALIYERGDFKHVAEQYHESCLWLLGPESFSRFEKIKALEPSAASCLLAESGYAIFRDAWKNGEHHLLFDCGPQSHGLFDNENVSTAHGHADPLNVLLCAHGRPMLIDGGMLTYNGDLNWQNYFRSGMAHNTITIEGRSSSRLVGRLGYSHAPEVLQSFATFQQDFALVEATYQGFGANVRHRRAVFYRNEEYWLLFDALEGEGEHTLERWFHFAPECQAQNGSAGLVAALPSAGNLLLRELMPHKLETEIFKAGPKPEMGWCAPSYGVKIPAPVARLRLRASLPRQFCTLLVPYKNKMPALQHEIEGKFGTHQAEPCAVRLASAQGNDLIVFNFSGELQTLGALTTDAKIAYLRRDLLSGFTTIAMVAGTQLHLNNMHIFQFEQRRDARVHSRELA
jgi:hypothetical protein